MNAPDRHTNRTANFADVDYAEAVARAHALIPLLREESAAMEKATQMTPRVLDAFHASGLFRYQQPTAWGGMELDFQAFYEIPEILARGDASAAWTFANLSSHHRQLSQWDERAQQEIWGEDRDALIASGIAYHQGQATRADGGLLLTGTWGFSSGVDPSTWNMLACVVREDDKPVDWCMCLVPVADYEIVDDWQTLGMRGTGSRTVRCKDVFVPTHRALSMQVSRPGHRFPGLAQYSNPMFRVPTSAMGGYGIGGVLLGNAQAALDATIESAKARSTSYTGAKMRDFPTVQLRVGMAAAKLDAVRAWFSRDCEQVSTLYKAGGTLDIEAKLRHRRNCAMGVKIANEALDLLHEMAGANGIYNHGPLERMFRDGHAGAAHFVFNMDAQMTPWGLVALGGEFKSPTM
ncbi:MAG: acyl-CoA dehydrogenase family protein [Burkholderiales bacterium]